MPDAFALFFSFASTEAALSVITATLLSNRLPVFSPAAVLRISAVWKHSFPDLLYNFELPYHNDDITLT